jgi:hypothetical protein
MLKKLLIVLVTVGAVSIASYANTTDSFTITVTVNLNYSVLITTDDVGMSYTMNTPSEVTQSTATWGAGAGHLSTATIMNNGSVTADWQIAGTINSAGNAWHFGSSKDTVASDTCTVCVILTDNDVSGIDIDTSWDDNDLLGGTGATPEWHNMTATLHNDGSADGENVAVNESHGLLYRIRMPSDVTTSNSQAITVHVRAMPSGTF